MCLRHFLIYCSPRFVFELFGIVRPVREQPPRVLGPFHERCAGVGDPSWQQPKRLVTWNPKTNIGMIIQTEPWYSMNYHESSRKNPGSSRWSSWRRNFEASLGRSSIRFHQARWSRGGGDGSMAAGTFARNIGKQRSHINQLYQVINQLSSNYKYKVCIHYICT